MAGSSFKLSKIRQSVGTITSAGSTTTLANNSDYWQYVTGSTTQTVKLPDATTMVVGLGFNIVNANSTGVVTVVDNGSNTLATLTAGSSFEFVCDNTSTANGVWIKSNGSGSSSLVVNSISSNTTLGSNSINLVDTTASRTLTLPTPTNGAIVIIKDSTGSAGTNVVTINPHASETIDGNPSILIVKNYGSYQLISDGTNWFILTEKNFSAYATGGTITNSGGFRIHTFTSSGTLNVIGNISSVQYLIVAGGGGGGSSSVTNVAAGGGGAGGFLTSTLSTLNAGSYSVTVGAGGPQDTAGSNSVFDAVTATGGSHGGDANPVGPTGGSGGASGNGDAGGSGAANGGGAPGSGGGGGGGSGAIGQSVTGGTGGNGGAGTSSSISGSAVSYAGGGGGGGGHEPSDPGGSGAAGGGGGGGSVLGFFGGNATANTGSGGGGGAGSIGQGGTGGSGIVIIRYQIT